MRQAENGSQWSAGAGIAEKRKRRGKAKNALPGGAYPFLKANREETAPLYPKRLCSNQPDQGKEKS